MKGYIGVTDADWANFLNVTGSKEANFWIPSDRPFKALQFGEPFLGPFVVAGDEYLLVTLDDLRQFPERFAFGPGEPLDRRHLQMARFVEAPFEQ